MNYSHNASKCKKSPKSDGGNSTFLWLKKRFYDYSDMKIPAVWIILENKTYPLLKSNHSY